MIALGSSVNRRELIQYVANKLGGAHIDTTRDEGKELDRRLKDLDKLLRGVTAGGLRPAYFELLSIGQALARSPGTERFLAVGQNVGDAQPIVAADHRASLRPFLWPLNSNVRGHWEQSSMTEDRWQNATAYEQYMGRWSRLLAAEFLSWLKAPPAANWLEIGCGTGALTSAILERASPGSVTACDTAEDFVAHCASEIRHPHFAVVAATTDTLPRRTSGYEVVVSSLVLNFLPDPVAGLARMREVCAPNGCVAACVWDYSEGMEFLRQFWDAAVSLDPKARTLDEGIRFPLCQAAALRSAFLRAGLERVAVEAVTIPTRFANFDDYWQPFVKGPGPAPTYVASLSESHRQELAALLRERLLRVRGRALDLRARAWAAKGTCGAR